MEFHIDKPKTYKGLSYVLKSSHLKEALEEFKLDLYIDLNYWTPQQLGSILSADYWLPNENVDHDRFYIRAGAIKSEERREAEKLMKNIVIPDLVRRIIKIKNEPPNSTKIKHGWFFEATYKKGVLRINNKEITTNPNNS